jgi:hypothetical protein
LNSSKVRAKYAGGIGAWYLPKNPTRYPAVNNCGYSVSFHRTVLSYMLSLWMLYCRCTDAYRPVYRVALDCQQMLVVTQLCEKEMPCRANLSMWGVLTTPLTCPSVW